MPSSSSSSSSLSSLDEQDAVTREWDGLAGEWDDLASVYAQSLYAHVTTSSHSSSWRNNFSCDWQQLVTETTTTTTTTPTTTNSPNTTTVQPQPQQQQQQQQWRMVDFGCGTGLWIEQVLQQSLKDSGSCCCDNNNNNEWHILALDASANMIRVLREKIRNCEWTNVQPLSTVLAQWDDTPTTTTATANNNNNNNNNNNAIILSEWWGTADIVVAWNVLSLVPRSDQAATMRQIARLLKHNGIFCHSDWPENTTTTTYSTTDDPGTATTTATATTASSSFTLPRVGGGNGCGTMNEERAQRLYAEGGLQVVSMELVPLVVAPHSSDRTVPVFVGVARKSNTGMTV
jgi:SAM-dependent methyltransferase